MQISNPSDWIFLHPAILNQMHDSIITTDMHGVVTGCNRAASQIYGYQPAELIGQHVSILYPEEERLFLEERVISEIRERGEFRGELRNRTRTGKTIFIHLSATVLKDVEGSPMGMVGFSIDITSQKLGELAVRATDQYRKEIEHSQQHAETRQLLYTAVERALDAVLITEAEPIDAPGPRILYVNRAFEQMTGYTRDEAIGQTPRMLQGPKTDRSTLARIRESLEARKPVREEMINYRKDGTEFHIELTIVPIADESGLYTHWVAIQRDITDRVRLREELENNQARLHYLTEAIPQLVWTANDRGECEFVSQATASFAGVSPEEMLGRGWTNYIHPEDREKTGQAWAEAIGAGAAFSTEFRLRRHDGQYCWFLSLAVPRRDPEGRIIEWIGSCTDISQQKLSEQALLRTEKLAAVGRLASSIAHEINNPLEAISNLLYLLGMQSSLDRTAREYVKTAQEELSRITQITSQTLRFHKQSTIPAPARLSEILDSVLTFYRPRLSTAGVQVLRDYRQTESVVCFASEIRHAITNLISNAIEAVGNDGRIRVRLRPSVTWKTRQRRGVRVTIGDNGCGIEKELLNRVFEPFFTTKPETGTGLGMWIARDLITKHGGKIKMRSSTRPGRTGTVVTFLLPFEASLEMRKAAVT